MKRKERIHVFGAGLVLFLLLLCTGCTREGVRAAWTQEASEEVLAEKSAGREAEAPETVLVHVCGEVALPGVYALEAGSRICDAVAAAGGMTENAAADSLNLAQEVKDGEKIRVPNLSEAAFDPVGGPEAGTEEGLVNLNTADADELATLPGIGKVKAEAILNYREERGGFSAIEELKEVSGIGDAIYEKLKEHITV